MRDCITTSTVNGTLPPNKRLNYTFGMVMGVDDFRQEQTHFEWKQGLSNLLLHGYGTVCGLAVTAELTADGNDVVIRIAKGYAVSPKGHWIWVDREQCAQLGAWIAANPPQSAGSPPESPPVSPPMPDRLYVKLCYDECLTDLVPVAGQPCATDEDTRAPSRIQEAYRAEFTWEKPPQSAQDWSRAFGQLLSQVELRGADSSPSTDDSALLLEAVRNLGRASELSPPDSSPLEAEFILPEETACETLHAALTIWVTEVCPRHQDEAVEDCILLACVDFERGGGDDLIPESVAITNCDRPVLVPTRLQQELFCLVNRHGVTDHSELENLEADDHPQYLRTDGTRPLTGDQSAGGNHITDLAEATTNGEAMPHGQTAGGDLRGTYPNPQVQFLQDRPVVMPPPANVIPANDVLTWTGSAWEPQPVPEVEPDLPTLDDLTDVSAPAPSNDQVLSWNQAQNQWVPRTLPPSGPGSGPENVVLRPADAGPYAIIASGIFDENGNPFSGLPTYGELSANQEGPGQFLLNFPSYTPDLNTVTYIVKGTIFNQPLIDFRGAGQDEILEREDELVRSSFQNPDIVLEPHPFPANFQVVDFTDEGILVWITLPVLRPDIIQALAQGAGGEFVLQHFVPTAKPFMVEISAYGRGVEDSVG